MFGYVSANIKELTQEQKQRYNSIYCGVCRQIRQRSGQVARLSLSYDMTFLALLLMSLYEPEETAGKNACRLHPIEKRPWVDNAHIGYSADMNVALAYFNCLDNWQDDGSLPSKWMAGQLKRECPAIAAAYPRQYAAIEDCIRQLSELERSNCPNPDEPANCFGQLMAELLVYEEDLWAPMLREMGMHLGRFIYLADAMDDFPKDVRRNKYNPFQAAQITDPSQQEQFLLLAMSRCTMAFEKLPLVQDKAILDNILYSGIWTHLRKKKHSKEAQS